MNKLIIVLLFILCNHLILVMPNAFGYKLRMERIVVSEQNEDYLFAKLWITKLNRYTPAAQGYVNLLKPFPSNTMVQTRCYEFLSNEYRPFAINMERKLCNFLEQEYKILVYPSFEANCNMPEPKCPLNPGNYTFVNITSSDNVPVHLPFSKSKLEVIFSTGNMVLLKVEIFATFDRDIVIRERYS